MKAKILSLALALMMIVSVFVALPVAAETGGKPIILNAIENVTLGSSNYCYMTDADKSKEPSTTVVDWANIGRVRLIVGNKSKAYATWSVNVDVSGNYEIFVAAARGTTSDSGIAADSKVFVTVNGGTEQTAAIKGTDSVVDVVSNSLGVYELSAGAVNTLKIAYGESEKPDLSIYSFKLVKVEDPVEVNIPANFDKLIKTEGASGSAYAKSDYTISDRVNCDWATNGAVAVPGTYGGGFWESFTAPESCYYDVWVAVGAASACDGSQVVAWVGNQAVRGTITSNARATAVGFNLGRIYIEEGQNKIAVVVKNARPETSSLGLALYDARLEKSENQNDSDAYVIDAQTFDPSTSANTISSNTFWASVTQNRAGWATNGYKHSSNLPKTSYTLSVATAGYYDVYVGASTGYNGKISVSANGGKIDGATLVDSNTAGSYTEVDSTYIGKVYLNKGLNTITMGTAANTTSYHLYNIKFEPTELPAPNVIRITDALNNDLSDVDGGSKVYAEVALPEGSHSVMIFLAQYSGSGDEKTMLVTTFAEETATAAYTVGGYNFYKTSLTTLEDEGILKAFLWKADETLAPLLATETVEVN